MYKQYQLKDRLTSNNHLSPRLYISNHKSKRNSLTKTLSNSASSYESQHSANEQKHSIDYEDDEDTSSSVTLRNEAGGYLGPL
uniref:Uncharacterized protein n=1 Tax=Meloidogyne hapla TaxID=6305 RepID=A0A1I8BQB2_MELHA